MKAVILHPLGYEEHPRGHEPDHFAHLGTTLTTRGHTVLEDNQIGEADVLLFDSGVRNVSGGGTSPYDWNVLGTVLAKNIPVVWFDYFDHAGSEKSQGRWPGTESWKDMFPYIDQGTRLHDWATFGYLLSRRLTQDRKSVDLLLYFMRKMQIHQDYPEWVHPLEYPIFEDFPLVTKEELSARPFDVCGLTNIGLTRAVAMIDLYRDGRLKLDCEIVPSYRRLDHHVWMDRHRQAKLFLEADASLGSERPLKLITLAPMLRVKSDHRLPFPMEDMVHMVEVGTYDGSITKPDVDKILAVVNNPDLLYSIYVNGAEHMRRHYSLEARSNYVVDLIEKFIKP
jgi:hypothetical protein